MQITAWDNRYATGIPSIDAQHLTLFESAKELHGAMRAGTAREAIPGLLNHLVVYCMTHFADFSRAEDIAPDFPET